MCFATSVCIENQFRFELIFHSTKVDPHLSSRVCLCSTHIDHKSRWVELFSLHLLKIRWLNVPEINITGINLDKN